MSQVVKSKSVRPRNLDVSRIVVKEAKQNDPKALFKRFEITYRYTDSYEGEFIMLTPPNLTSFGLAETRGLDDKKALTGYQVSLMLYSKDGATEEEREFVEAFNKVSDYLKEYFITNSFKLVSKKPKDMEAASHKFNPLWYKKIRTYDAAGNLTNEEEDFTRGPTLYAKCIVRKGKNFDPSNPVFDILTRFNSTQTHLPIKPMDLLGKRCRAQGAIKFESVFAGKSVSLQIKLREAQVEELEQQNQSFFGNSIEESYETVGETKEAAETKEESETEHEIKDDDSKAVGMAPVAPVQKVESTVAVAPSATTVKGRRRAN